MLSLITGVIDLLGGVGGLVEFKASLLASNGFAALALAYFAYDDLPVCYRYNPSTTLRRQQTGLLITQKPSTWRWCSRHNVLHILLFY